MKKNDDMVRLYGVNINNTDINSAVDMIITSINDWFSDKGSVNVGFFVNVHSFNLAYKDAFFSNILTQSQHVFADGVGVDIAAKKAGYKLCDNVNGTDMLPIICNKFSQDNKGIYFLGAKEGVAQKAADNLRHDYPNLKVSGVQHGYFDKDSEQNVIDNINQSGCSLLLVAFGSPIQEKWIISNKDKLTIPYALAVGGLLDFYSGHISRAPSIWRALKCEWIWRLIQEPKRMWRRYIIGNPVFLLRTFFNKKELKR